MDLLANAKTNAVPSPKEGTLSAQDWVLTTSEVMTKVQATNAVTEVTK